MHSTNPKILAEKLYLKKSRKKRKKRNLMRKIKKKKNKKLVALATIL